MLEIASEIIVCLLIAATIGAAIGYLVCKSLSKKTEPASVEPHTEEKATEEEKEVVAEETPEVIKEDIEKVLEVEEKNTAEEVEIPTEDAIEKALEALEEIDVQDDEMPEAEEEPAKKPELLSSPRNGEKDALTKIKGLGPKLEEKLNTAGIYHFDQIASWTEADFEWLEVNTTFAGRAKKDDWVSQAKSFI